MVQAKLKDPRYAEVAPVSATLVVVANLILDPSIDSFILVGGLIPYKVKQIRQNSVEDIVMPNTQYFLSVGECVFRAGDKRPRNSSREGFVGVRS